MGQSYAGAHPPVIRGGARPFQKHVAVALGENGPPFRQEGVFLLGYKNSGEVPLPKPKWGIVVPCPPPGLRGRGSFGPLGPLGKLFAS